MTHPGDDAIARERAELTTLTAELRKHDDLYYNASAPEIDDALYDALKSRYLLLAVGHPDLDVLKDRVGAPASSPHAKHAHARPMLSLANAFTAEDVAAFLARTARFLGVQGEAVFPLFVDLKIDGVSFSARYSNGKLTLGLTRGDGKTGENVTDVLAAIRDLPAEVAETSSFEVRGEIYLEKASLPALNADREAAGLPPYMNPRNGASGLLRQLDGAFIGRDKLRCFVYSAFFSEGRPASHTDVLRRLASYGFVVNPVGAPVSTKDELLRYYDDVLKNRAALPYEIDGLVLKVDSLAFQEQLGAAGRFPRWAAAWKFPPEETPAFIERIDVQVGRTGVLTPVARLQPTAVGGVVVSNISLHNADYIRAKDIREGDWAYIKRSGDVIPQITRVLDERRNPGSQPWDFPTHCPACGTACVKEEESAARCPNEERCPDQHLERLRYAFSRECLDIRGLGERRLASLIRSGKVVMAADIFTLKPEDITELAREGEKSADNLLKSLEAGRSVPLHRYIRALGIRGLGGAGAEKLAEKFPEGDLFLSMCEALADARAASWESAIEHLPAALPFLAVDGIGPSGAEHVAAYFAAPFFRLAARRLLQALQLKEPARPLVSGHPLTGKTVVVTGSFEGYTRERMRALLKLWGAKTAESVSSKTDLVLAGADAGSKLEKARKLSVLVEGPEEWEKYASAAEPA